MTGGGDNGMLLGMMASRRAQQRGAGRPKGESSMFNVFPLMIIPVIIYAVMVSFTGGDLSAAIFDVPMANGRSMSLNQGDLIAILGLAFLFIEMVKAAGSGTATIINHAASMLVFVIALGMFLLMDGYGTSVFFFLMLMTLMDTMAGFIITIVAARRDLAVGGE